MQRRSAKVTKGNIHLIPFPFTDLCNAKLRPCVILGADREDMVVVFITSKKPKDRNFIEILPTNLNGLKAKSFIRYTKIATLDVHTSLGRIGVLDKKTHSLVISRLVEFLS